jgi:small subunit ribosomal protein S15
MAKMHSRKKGSSRSRPPMVQKIPDWCDTSKEELGKTIMKLHDQGMPANRIGMTLRDQYGVPSVSPIIGVKLGRYLKDNGAQPQVPEDLSNLMRNYHGVGKLAPGWVYKPETAEIAVS